MPSELLTRRTLEAIRALPPMQVQLMEICGTHTMEIAKAGLRSVLPEGVRLVSGPGCPVCVTPAGAIDEVLRVAMLPDVIVASYGDLLRVPGSTPGDHLLRRRAMGAQVRVVYSAMDALELAAAQPEKRVLFLGVGFETTAPGTAACILEAQQRNIRNFFVYSMLKRTEPAIRALAAHPDFAVDGFLCPGHVAAITGAEAFRFLPEELHLPAVVAGFTPEDLLASVCLLLRQLADGTPKLENEYIRAVSPRGNPAAQAIVDRVFFPADSDWRGLGAIAQSGSAIREAFAPWDAAREFGLHPEAGAETPGCRCGDVIRGVLHPTQCPLFGKGCLPERPVGPCMVSSEGACAAAYRYGEV